MSPPNEEIWCIAPLYAGVIVCKTPPIFTASRIQSQEWKEELWEVTPPLTTWSYIFSVSALQPNFHWSIFQLTLLYL